MLFCGGGAVGGESGECLGWGVGDEGGDTGGGDAVFEGGERQFNLIHLLRYLIICFVYY